ncbi:MAG: hypothetical protein KDH92_08535 [Chloroflexi bacterium]|nr:hypothetical protein [Chloroflexota bacterium]
MGLYLCVFSSDEDDSEIDGVEVGSYDDFHLFRDAVSTTVEKGHWGDRCPILMLHEDSESAWSPEELPELEKELELIREAFAREKMSSSGTESLRERFVDVEGAPLVDRLIALVQCARQHDRPIEFQ